MLTNVNHRHAVGQGLLRAVRRDACKSEAPPEHFVHIVLLLRLRVVNHIVVGQRFHTVALAPRFYLSFARFLFPPHFGKKTSGYYPGELLMITKNNKPLDLYNGDCGVAVTFTGDETLYVMFKKSAELNYDEGRQENRIFRLGEYLFYPLRVINAEDITSAFAITIHKSQGSDYQNILVILPRTHGHPMLNRQIVYTAVTRTKGNTVILSNQANLECARDHVLTRDTGIFE